MAGLARIWVVPPWRGGGGAFRWCHGVETGFAHMRCNERLQVAERYQNRRRTNRDEVQPASACRRTLSLRQASRQTQVGFTPLGEREGSTVLRHANARAASCQSVQERGAGREDWCLRRFR